MMKIRKNSFATRKRLLLIILSICCSIINASPAQVKAGGGNHLLKPIKATEEIIKIGIINQSLDRKFNNVDLAIRKKAAAAVDNVEVENRISGGVIADQNEYPWMVFLQMFQTSTSTDAYVCGGTLINNQWVMTAAVCLDGFVKIDVYLGAHNLVASSEQYRVKYTSTNFTKHPSWRAGSTANNIGLIKLPSTISFTNQIKAIGLPSTSEGDHLGDTVYLAGWGAQTGSSSSLSQYLRKVTTTVMSNVECQSFYGTASVTGSDMCSSGTDLVGICSGDNGGPMMYQTNGNFIQLGVASFWYGQGQGCSSGFPSGFVRVSKYVDWIDSTTTSPPFECPELDGSYADPDSCSNYFLCVAGVPYPLVCPGDLVFNPQVGRCDELVNVPSCIKPFVCPQPNGQFANSLSCSTFYVCVNSVPYLADCPSGLYFNPANSQCDAPENVPDCQ